MNKLQDKKQINFMMLLFALIYFISYISRINFGAVILEMVRAEGFLKSDVSLAITASFITYGVFQLVSGFLGDRINPKHLMLAGLLVTSVTNFLIPFCPSPAFMIAVWAINGASQSFMWPPLVKIMTMLFDEETYRTATVRVSWGSSAGTIAVYLLAPFFVSTSIGWRGIFFFASGACVVMSAIWLFALRNTDTGVSGKAETKTEYSGKSNSRFGAFAICGIVIAIICQGALRDGITTWMPTYIAEVYNLGSSISILTGVVLPVFSLVCFQITLWLRNKKVNNEVMLSGYIFIAGVVSALLLLLTSSKGAALSVLLAAILTGSMHGVNLLLVCMVPSYFAKASTASGALNAFTYVGSALSTYGIAAISEKFGWNMTIAAWAALAALGGLVCFLSSCRKNNC